MDDCSTDLTYTTTVIVIKNRSLFFFHHKTIYIDAFDIITHVWTITSIILKVVRVLFYTIEASLTISRIGDEKEYKNIVYESKI